MKNLAKIREKEANILADRAIEKMKGMSLKDIENLVLRQPDDVAKLILIKIIRRSS